jgi:hypothetical protein
MNMLGRRPANSIPPYARFIPEKTKDGNKGLTILTPHRFSIGLIQKQDTSMTMEEWSKAIGLFSVYVVGTVMVFGIVLLAVNYILG